MSNKVTFLYLSMPDVIKTNITFTNAMELVTESLKAHGLKEVENPPKPGVHTRPNAFINAMPGWLKSQDLCGLKWVSGYPENIKHKLPSIVGTLILNNPETGLPIAVMDGTYITAMRTAAVSGVTAKVLARKDSKVLSIIGTGVQGKYNTLCLTAVVPSINKIRIFDTWAPSLKSYQDQIKPLLPNIEIEVASSMEDAVRGADIVVAATATLTGDVYQAEWVSPGALILPIQTAGWSPENLGKLDGVFSDDWHQLINFGEFGAYKDNPELGEIISGKKPGRNNDQEKIICFSKGLAVHDILCGTRVLELAKQKGLGVELELIDLSAPIPLPPV